MAGDLKAAQYYTREQLPIYLEDYLSNIGSPVKVLDLDAIRKLDCPLQQYAGLLFRRHTLTHQIAEVGLHPPLLHSRASVYEILGYDDLAAADAFVAYTLCETVRSEEWVSDLQPVELSGQAWPSDDQAKNLEMLCEALATLCRVLVKLGATEDARNKLDELVERCHDCNEFATADEESVWTAKVSPINGFHSLIAVRNNLRNTLNAGQHKSGWSRREVYPWNDYEPDRNSSISLSEINAVLALVAPNMTAKVTALPALQEDGSTSDEVWHQLGLFAAKDFPPGAEILREKSLLTAIRPLDDALCDACGADLESVFRESMRQCPGEDCDTTFCSEDCAVRASQEYHRPNTHQETGEDEDKADEDSEDIDTEYPPPHAPFCGNTILHEIGRTESTTTSEWDLYFLLLTRTIQTATTQQIHPLSLPSTKFLWGDFNPPPDPSNPVPTLTSPKCSLPWSLHHNLTLPLQYFETLMHSIPEMKPYSATWLANYDWWIQSTLVAKFRGVANAQQSTFDGKAEIAAVHPMWCLANHSCEPNVRWTPTGERVFTVRGRDEVVGNRDGKVGIKEGEEIWSHYTDVRLPLMERRERLMEVLGGVCRCSRCLREAGEVST